MKVSACLKLASSALLMGTTAGRDRLRRTQTRGGNTEIIHGWEWLTNAERDIGTGLANVGIFAAKPNATTNSTMPGGMANSTMPGMVNSTMPGSMDNTTMPGSMANTTTTTNVTRRTQTRGGNTEIIHGWEWLTNAERDIGTGLANVGIFAVTPNATTNSTMPGGMANSTMPGMVNSTMPGSMDNTTMPGSMANTTTTTTTNVTRRGQTVGAVNHSSEPMSPGGARNATTDATEAAGNTTMPGMANNTTPAGSSGAMPAPTRANSTTVGGRNVSGLGGFHRMLRAMDYASSIANATATNGPLHVSANSTAHAAASAANSTAVNSTMPGGMANTTTNSTAAMPPTTRRFLMDMMANATMPMGSMDNATMPMGSNTSVPMSNSSMPMSNTTTNATMGGVGSTTRFLTYGVRAMANATIPGMMNSTMPMGSHNATTNSTMPAGVANATMPMSNTTTVGGTVSN